MAESDVQKAPVSTPEQRTEGIAQVLHERRHPLGSAPSCGLCRGDAEAVAAL